MNVKHWSFSHMPAAALTLSLMASAMTLVVAPVAHGDVAEEHPWSGTISVGFSMSSVVAGVGSTVSGSGTYTGLAQQDGGLDYAANVVVDFSGSNSGYCPETEKNQVITTAEWDFSGASTATFDAAGNSMAWATGTGAAFRLQDTETGTFFTPYAVVFNALQQWKCGEPAPAYQAYDALSYQFGYTTAESDKALVDEDPSPDRLVGTSHYSLDNFPGVPAWEYSAYSYTVTYDLTRGEDTSCGPDEVDSDGDGIADACEPLEAVNDDGLVDDSFVTVYEDGSGMSFDVLDNDIGDDIEVVDVVSLGHDEGAVNPSASGVTWGYTNPAPGIYQFTYTIRDRYFRESSATVTVRVDCAATNKITDKLQWTAGTDGPGPDLDLYVLEAEYTYCEDNGNFTAFELTPSATGEASSILGFLGFDLQAGEVSYLPPRDRYPAMTVSGTVRFDMCIDPATLLFKLGGRTIDRVVTREIDQVLERNLRRSGEWTAESLSLGLNNARDGLLKEIAREIRGIPGLGGEAGDFVVEVVDGSLRTAINTAISQVVAAAGPAAMYGMSPDEVAVWATRELISKIPQACAPVWEPVVELVGRPDLGPLPPSPPASLYTNPFLVVRLTS